MKHVISNLIKNLEKFRAEKEKKKKARGFISLISNVFEREKKKERQALKLEATIFSNFHFPSIFFFFFLTLEQLTCALVKSRLLILSKSRYVFSSNCGKMKN